MVIEKIYENKKKQLFQTQTIWTFIKKRNYWGEERLVDCQIRAIMLT